MNLRTMFAYVCLSQLDRRIARRFERGDLMCERRVLCAQIDKLPSVLPLRDDLPLRIFRWSHVLTTAHAAHHKQH